MILYLTLFFEFIAFLLAFITRRFHDRIFKLFFLNLVVVVINEILVSALIKLPGIPRMIANASTNLYFLIEIYIVSLVGLILVKNKFLKILLRICLLLFSIIWTYLFIKDGLTRLLIPAVLTGDILGAFVFLVLTINMIGTPDIVKQPLFIISLGYIIFYCCNIPYFGILFYLYKIDESLLGKLRNILFVINIIRYSLTAYSFYLLKKQQTATPALNV